MPKDAKEKALADAKRAQVDYERKLFYKLGEREPVDWTGAGQNGQQ